MASGRESVLRRPRKFFLRFEKENGDVGRAAFYAPRHLASWPFRAMREFRERTERQSVERDHECFVQFLAWLSENVILGSPEYICTSYACFYVTLEAKSFSNCFTEGLKADEYKLLLAGWKQLVPILVFRC